MKKALVSLGWFLVASLGAFAYVTRAAATG
jgi:hypothetical protein